MSSPLLTPDLIGHLGRLDLVARLVVLSGGCAPADRGYIDEGYLLPSAFLAAGQCSL